MFNKVTGRLEGSQMHATNDVKRNSLKVKSSKTIKRLIEDYIVSERGQAVDPAPWELGRYNNRQSYNHANGFDTFGIRFLANTNIFIRKAEFYGNHNPPVDRLLPMLADISNSGISATERLAVKAMVLKVIIATGTTADDITRSGGMKLLDRLSKLVPAETALMWYKYL